MSRRVSLCVVCLMAVACTSTPASKNPFAHGAPATPAATSEASYQRDAKAPGRLQDSVVLLGSSPDSLAPSALGRAFRDLAGVIQSLDAESALEARRIADEIEAAAPSSLAHGALCKRGLEQVLQALLARPVPDARDDEYRDALRALDAAVKNVKDVTPLDEQRAEVGAAFRAATDAVFVALSEEPPFRTPVPSRVHEALPNELELERARNAILELARSRWTNGREAASRALGALADVVASARPGDALQAQITELRFQAKRLVRSEAATYEEAAGVKRALSAAVDALERLGNADTPTSSDWTRAARRAVDSIEERSTINLQRAAVQDAFRSTIDAFAATAAP